MTWENFGDVSVDHGQTWIKPGGDDYAECVEIIGGCDVSFADNQYLIRKGSIYFSPDRWDEALSIIGSETYGPPEYHEIAYGFYSYQGMDPDPYLPGFCVVQIGAKPDPLSINEAESVDVVLHGNASIEKYLEREFLT